MTAAANSVNERHLCSTLQSRFRQAPCRDKVTPTPLSLGTLLFHQEHHGLVRSCLPVNPDTRQKAAGHLSGRERLLLPKAMSG